MKKKLIILCQIISLVYVTICLVVLFKTQNKTNAEYARVKKTNTESISSTVERVHSGAIKMLSN